MSRWRVIGNHEVLGHKPGAEFNKKLSEADQEFYVAGGHLEPATAPSKPGATTSKKEEEK